jgi:hypothetical protein
VAAFRLDPAQSGQLSGRQQTIDCSGQTRTVCVCVCVCVCAGAGGAYWSCSSTCCFVVRPCFTSRTCHAIEGNDINKKNSRVSQFYNEGLSLRSLSKSHGDLFFKRIMLKYKWHTLLCFDSNLMKRYSIFIFVFEFRISNIKCVYVCVCVNFLNRSVEQARSWS